MPGTVAFWKQALVAAALVGAGWYGWQEREAIAHALGLAGAEQQAGGRRGAEGVPVLVAPVTSADDDLVLEAVGTGRAVRSVTLRVEAEGKIAELALAAGRTYAKGDVLVKLEDADQQLALKLAEARQREADRVLARLARLEDAGTAARARLDEVRTLAEIAGIEVERAKEHLEDRVLRAPFDGVAGLADLEVGAWIDSDVDIASFDDRSTILVEFDLPEALLPRVDPGLAVAATTPSAPGERFEGAVAAIDSRVTATSRTTKVRVALPNPGDRLRPGASFTVRLDLPGPTYPVVPELAVQFARGALHVWRVTDGAAERVEVRMVRRRDGAVLVDGPLRAGDRVIVEGTQRLAPGKPVRVMQSPAGTS